MALAYASRFRLLCAQHQTLQRMVITYTFPGCWFFVDEPGSFSHTAFLDGARLESIIDGAKDGRTSYLYGYGDDVWRLWREHDLLHHAIGTLFGHGYSPTIWSVAHPDDPRALARWVQRDEERFLGFVHRWLNLGQWHPELGLLETFGRTRAELRAELRALISTEITTFSMKPLSLGAEARSTTE